MFVRNLTLLELCTYLFFLSTVILQYSYLDRRRVIVRLNTPTYILIFFLFFPLVLRFTDGITDSKGNF
jgi:hypothetical protein